MPKGRGLSKEVRRVIYELLMVQRKSCDEVFQYLVNIGVDISFRHFLENIARPLLQRNEEILRKYTADDNPVKPRTKKRRMLEEQRNWLESQFIKNRRVTLREARDTFRLLFDDVAVPSCTTIWNNLQEHNIRYKVIQSLKKRADPEEQLAYLEFMGVIDSNNIVDIDGLVQNGEDFMIKYGWTPSESDGIEYQMKFGDKSFSVMAAYTEMGFIAWSISEKTVTQYEVESFVELLEDFILDDSFAILDNAKHQKTPLVRTKLEEIFHGNYRYVSAYSPIFKPIEKGFANIKLHIQRMAYDNSWMDPYDVIEEAFRYYSISGAGGNAGLNYHFLLLFFAYNIIFD